MCRFPLVLAALLPLTAGASEIATLLGEADSFRRTTAALRVDTEVQVFKNGALDKTRLYSVYLKPGRRSLVLFRSPAERGQKLLMLGDDFWLMLPTSQRPLRITPMQKLLGDASTGDVANMSWAEDYDGRIVGETIAASGVPCIKLDLAAQRKGLSYPRIVLSLAQEDHRPVEAELYVASDKLAKLATFQVSEVDGRRMVSRMILTDRLQRDRRTEVNYLERSPETLGEEYYNPAFLVRAAISP